MRLKSSMIAAAGLLAVVGCRPGGGGAPRVTVARAAVTATSVSWTATEILGRPTDSSVTLKAVAAAAVEAYVEYGTSSGSYPAATTSATFSDGFVEILVASLSPDTGYVYRLRSRVAGSTGAFAAGTQHSFHTQRPRGESYSFAVQADSHQGYPGFYNDALYRTTLQNILAEQDDFMLDLGDTFSLDDATETTATVAQKYVNQLAVFGLAAHSTPVFLVLGNHEREEGWNLAELGSDVADTLPVLNANARKQYFVNPVPDSFYSGDTDTSGGSAYVSGDHLRGDYYAFEWGDALFVAIEPYWYSMKKPYAGEIGGDLSTAPVGTRWDWTLGQQQYQWLQQTLANSTATYKFVFAHHVAGGIDDYGRGGVLAAKYCEWGGYDTDGTTYTFNTNRPGWAMPVHQLLAQNHVTVFFHAHDHVYAKETLDGVVYQEMPMAANANYDTGFGTNPTDYAGTTLIPNSGHLKVTVSPTAVTVAYVRSFNPGDGTNGSIAASYTLAGSCGTQDSDGDGTPDCLDGCPTDPKKIAPGLCGCGVPDTDANGNGIADCLDADASPTAADAAADAAAASSGGSSGAAAAGGNAGVLGIGATAGVGGATSASGAGGIAGASGNSGVAGTTGGTGAAGEGGAIGASGAAGGGDVVGTGGAPGGAGVGTSGAPGGGGVLGTSGAPGGGGLVGTSGAPGGGGVVGTSGAPGGAGAAGNGPAVGGETGNHPDAGGAGATSQPPTGCNCSLGNEVPGPGALLFSLLGGALATRRRRRGCRPGWSPSGRSPRASR
jgi:MYXO-CTERM domain-containing protein